MSREESDLVKLLISMRDAYAMTVEAINAYLAAKAPAEVQAEAVETLFPQDLRNMLTFTAEGDSWIIKPKRFLGSENFAKIAAIVKEHKGDYVSQEKNSHFRIPKQTAK